MIDIRNHEEASVLFVTFRDRVSHSDLEAACREVCRITDTYEGAAHLTRSDVRAMSMPLTGSQERALFEAVRYQRAHGMKFCVHVVDPRTTRGLQLERALEAARSPGSEDATVYSMEEATRVLGAARVRLGLTTSVDMGSIASNMEGIRARMQKLTGGRPEK